MWYAFLPIIWPFIALLDTIILTPLPVILIWKRKPGLALAACIMMSALLIADHLVNFDGITYPLQLFAAPTETLPISLMVLIVTGAIAAKKWMQGP
jgi:hypothetical protein